MNIQSRGKINFQERQQRITKLNSKLENELDALTDDTETDAELFRAYDFADSQRVSTYESRLSDWKTAGKVALGAAGGALVGYQGGKVGAIGNGAMAVAGMTFATMQDSRPEIGEMIPGGLVSIALVALPGLYGGVPGAIGGAIAGGLAAVFGNELAKSR